MRLKLLLVVCAAVFHHSGRLDAGPITFTVIADSNTPIPGGTGNFTSFSSPSLDGRNVAFIGRGASGQQGIYSNIGGISVVADTNTEVPKLFGSTLFFTKFSSPSISGSNIAFQGSSNTAHGVYADIGGLDLVANTFTTSIPDGTGRFSNFGSRVSISGENVAFSGTGLLGQAGVYTNTGGTLNTVANQTDSIPGGSGNFNSFSSPSIAGPDVAFRGFGPVHTSIFPQSGVYTNIGGLTAVADQNTHISGGTGTFLSLLEPSLDGGGVAFIGGDSSFDRGIYANTGGVLDVVANTTIVAPGGSGNFSQFSSTPSFDTGHVAFFANVSGVTGHGIYTNVGGSLDVVIDRLDALDGKTVSSLGFDREGLSGNTLAFRASFTDGSQGIYLAELESANPVPEPSSLALLATGAGVLIGYRRRRMKRTVL